MKAAVGSDKHAFQLPSTALEAAALETSLQPPSPSSAALPPTVQDLGVLLRSLFHSNPQLRPTAEQTLQHKYYAGTGKVTDRQRSAAVQAALGKQREGLQQEAKRMAGSVAVFRQTQRRLLQGVEALGVRQATLTCRQAQAVLQEHLAILELEEDQLDAEWGSVAAKWAELAKAALELDEGSKRYAEQLRELQELEDQEACTRAERRSEVLPPLHWACGTARCQRMLTNATEQWRNGLQEFMVGSLRSCGAVGWSVQVPHFAFWFW